MPIQVAMMPPPPPPENALDTSDEHPVKSGGMITFGLLGAGLLVVLLLVRKCKVHHELRFLTSSATRHGRAGVF